jgi:hypothetical protein
MAFQKETPRSWVWLIWQLPISAKASMAGAAAVHHLVGQSQQQWWKAPTNKSLAGIHKTRHSLSSNSPSKRDCYGSYVSGRVYPDYAALHF